MILYKSLIRPGITQEFDCAADVFQDALGESWGIFADEPSALSEQVGGNHYKGMAIQPIIYIHNNGLGYLEGNVIKYISRHKLKGGKDDVLKAIHYCNLILELEYAK